jgi:hypothetical protein
MRMWMIDPTLLCNKHLLGEHGEIHKHKHSFVKKHNIRGRIIPIVQIEPSSMQVRHDALATEMAARNMNHQSIYEMPDISYLDTVYKEAIVDIAESIIDLTTRCAECARRINGQTRNDV